MTIALIVFNVLAALLNFTYTILAWCKLVYERSSEKERKGMMFIHLAIGIFNLGTVLLLIAIL